MATVVASRRGFMLIETFVALILLAIALTTFVPLVKGITRTQRAVERQRLALREAQNLLERISQLPWDTLKSESLKQLGMSDSSKSFLPDSFVRIDVADQSEPVVSKRVVVQVSWIPAAGRPNESVQLTAWIPAKEPK